MAGTSAAHLVLFIAALAVAASVSGALIDTVGNLQQSFTEQSDRLEERVDADFVIISDAGSSSVYNSTEQNVTLLVKNTGGRQLPEQPSQINLIIDGEYITASEYTTEVITDNAWDRGEVLRVEVDRQLDAGDHRVKMVIEGDESTFRFNV